MSGDTQEVNRSPRLEERLTITLTKQTVHGPNNNTTITKD